jgi:hypothetical protein
VFHRLYTLLVYTVLIVLGVHGEDVQNTLLLSFTKFITCSTCLFVCFWGDSPQWARASSFTRFLYHTQRRATVGRTHLDEWSARRRDLYLTTLNTHNRQTSMPPVGFEPTILAGERPKTYALYRLHGHWDRHLFNIIIIITFLISSKIIFAKVLILKEKVRLKQFWILNPWACNGNAAV